MNKSSLMILLVAFLVMLPAASAEEISNGDKQCGPNTAVSSPGAIALGNSYTLEGGSPGPVVFYGATTGLFSLALVPAGVEGWACADWSGSDSMHRTIDLNPALNHGNILGIDLAYSNAHVRSEVLKTTPNPGNAIAFSIIGAGGVDSLGPFAMGLDIDNNMLGAAGMMSLLALPRNCEGSSEAEGFVSYDLHKLGEPLCDGCDEVNHVWGEANGRVALDGATSARAGSRVFGISALGGTSFARDPAGYAPNLPGRNSWAVAGSGLGTLTFATKIDPAFNHPNPNMHDDTIDIISATASGYSENGAWDGSTPYGTYEWKGLNENAHSYVGGTETQLAVAYEHGDVAATIGTMLSFAVHSSSPVYIPESFVTLPDQLLTDGVGADAYGYVKKNAEVGTNEAFGLLGEMIDKDQTFLDRDPAGANGYVGAIVDNMPEIIVVDNEGNEVDTKDADRTLSHFEAAGNVVLTGAAAQRTQAGITGPPVTAEVFLSGGQTSGVARSPDNVVRSSLDNVNVASGVHITNGGSAAPAGPGVTYGSGALIGQVATRVEGPVPVSDIGGTASAYAILTLGPGVTGERWDDAGSYIGQPDDNGISGSMMTGYGEYPDQVDYGVDNPNYYAINWVAGNDPGRNGNLHSEIAPAILSPSGATGRIQASGSAPIHASWTGLSGNRGNLVFYGTANGGLAEII